MSIDEDEGDFTFTGDTYMANTGDFEEEYDCPIEQDDELEAQYGHLGTEDDNDNVNETIPPHEDDVRRMLD